MNFKLINSQNFSTLTFKTHAHTSVNVSEDKHYSKGKKKTNARFGLITV